MSVNTIPQLRIKRICYEAKKDSLEMENLHNLVGSYFAEVSGFRGASKILHWESIDDKLCVYWEAIELASLDEEYCRNNIWMSLEEIRNCLNGLIDLLTLMHQNGIAHLNIQPQTIYKIKRSEYKLSICHFEKPSYDYYSYDSYPFLAPEQFVSDRGHPGTATDVYALATTLYFMHTGQSPFDRTEVSLQEIQRQHLHETPTLRGLPKLLRPVFERALSKDPRSRPSIHEFYEQFEQVYQRIDRNRTREAMSRRQAMAIIGSTIIALGIVLDRLLSWVFSSSQKLPMTSAGTDIGHTILIFPKHTATVNALSPSPDARYILSADQSGRWIIWDPINGNNLHDDNRQHNKIPIVAVAWWKNNQVFATLSSDGVVWLWQLQQDGQYSPFATHTFATPTNAIAFSPTGDHLVISSDDDLLVFDFSPDNPFGSPDPTFEGRSEEAGGTNSANSIAIAGDGSFGASGWNDATARTWYVDTGKQILIYQGHSREVSAVAISPDGQWVVSGGVDRSVQAWNAYHGFLIVFYKHDDSVCAVTWSPDSQYVASGGDDNVIRIVDMNNRPVYTSSQYQAGISTIAWLPGHRIISSSGQVISIWRSP